MDFETATGGAKAWKDIWGAGQGIGAVKSVEPVADLVDRLANEYEDAKSASAARPEATGKQWTGKAFTEFSKPAHSRLEIRQHCLYQPAMKLIRNKRVTIGPL